MRSHRAILAVAIGAAAVAVPAVAGAAPSGPSLTINATPNPVLAGAGVSIYGQLGGSDYANQPIDLYHRLAGSPRFTLVSKGTTNGDGFYEFTRADGVVETNRNWYVTAPDGARSPIVHEQVEALVSLNASSTTGTTRHAIVFSGTVSPSVQDGHRILLQKQTGVDGTSWTTIASTRITGHGTYRIAERFGLPGDDTVRALLPGDAYNIASPSDSVTVAVQQAQNPSFTINSANEVSTEASPVTISGTLFEAKSTTTPEANTQVTLFGKEAGGRFADLGTATTGSNGAYSFTETPTHNTVYYVALTSKPSRHTALVYQGVRDSLTAMYSATSVATDDPITVSGSVEPDKAGHEITLQRLGADGAWHDIRYGTVNGSSKFAFTVRFGEPGTVDLRVRIDGGPYNVGAASAEQAITVTAPTDTAPPAGS